MLSAWSRNDMNVFQKMTATANINKKNLDRYYNYLVHLTLDIDEYLVIATDEYLVI